MNVNYEVLVVSAFGRGNWLAAELAKDGLQVVLFDVSRAFGHWAPEDWEGPFGLFQAETMSESQVTRLHEEDYMEAVPEGFVVWTKDGVLDTAGPLANELLQKWNVDAEQIQYLRKPVEGQMKKAWQNGFANTWFLNLCHGLALSTFVENSEAAQTGAPLPVFSPHFVRRASRRGYEQNLEWVASKGVKVLDKVQLVDLVSTGKTLQGFEVSSDFSGVINAEQFVWCLTSEETEHISRPIREKIMPSGVVKSEWQWQRYRIQIKGNSIHRDIPLSVVCIEDIGLPWAHENIFVLQRAVTGDDYDLWLRLPSSQRFHRKYIVEKGQKALQFLKRRLPGCEMEFNQWPAEATYDNVDLGPARFPIYSENENRKALLKTSWNNLYLDSAETWARLDWSGTFAAQTPIRASVQDWKVKKEEALRKQKEATP